MATHNGESSDPVAGLVLPLGWNGSSDKLSQEVQKSGETKQDVTATNGSSQKKVVTASLSRAWTEDGRQAELWPKKNIYSEITRFSEERRVNYVQTPVQADNFMNSNSLSDIRGELAAMRIKCERLQTQLKESQSLASLKEARLTATQDEAGRYREDHARQSAIAQVLQHRLLTCEEELTNVRRSLRAEELTVSSLINEKETMRNRLDGLEERLGSHLMGREQAEQHALNADRQLNETLIRLHALLGAEEEMEDPPEIESILVKVSELVRSNAHLRARVVAVGGALANRESEVHVNERALAQLLTELETERKESRVWQDTGRDARRRNEELEQQAQEVHAELNETRERLRTLQVTEIAERKYSQDLLVLRETLATLLATSPVDQDIKDNIRQILAMEKKYKEESTLLRAQLTSANGDATHEREARIQLEEALQKSKKEEGRHQMEMLNERKLKEEAEESKIMFEDALKRLHQRLWRGERKPWPEITKLNEELTTRLEELLQHGEETDRELTSAQMREKSLREELSRKSMLDDCLERERVEAKDEAHASQLELAQMKRRLQDSMQQLQQKQAREETMQQEIKQLHKKVNVLERTATKRLWGSFGVPSKQSKPRPGSAFPLASNEQKMRSSVVRMLGLDVGTEPATDEKILRRLQSLVEAQRDIISKKSDVLGTGDDHFHQECVGTSLLRAIHKH